MEISELFGLPAHPLFVHAAVVLLPLAAIATLLVAVVPRLRRYAGAALVLAIVALVFVGLAQGSGEELEEHVEETPLVEEHAGEGERVLPWAIGLVVVSGIVVALPRLEARFPNASSPPATAVLVVVTLVASVGAMWSVIEVGHSGAKATWNDVTESEND